MMSSHLVFNGVGDAVKGRIESYWARKRPRLEKLLAPYPEDVREIRLTISHHEHDPRHELYEARGVVILPTGTLAVEATDDDPQVVVDRIVDTLVAEIRRHKEKVRKDCVYKRRNRNREDLSAAGPRLQQHREAGNRDDFFRRLRPHLGFLRDYARREIRMLEQDGTLHRGELTVDDLLDQVVILAYERFKDRPRKVSLDLWLTDLVDDALEQWIKQEPRPHVSLEDRAEKFLPAEPPRDDDDPWWAELMDEEERLGLEDLIPDPRETAPWTNLEAEAQRDRLLGLIAKLPPERRQAFLLHALEGYATGEIAMLQDRPESEVKADIAAARQWLRKQLQAEGLVGEDEDEPAASAGEVKAVATW
jgi:RNA polymerase sigma factor (sigma-70 family)